MTWELSIAGLFVGTDMLHAALLLWVAGARHVIHGNVDLHAMAWLLVGSIPGVLLGSHFSIRVPERALRLGFAFVLVLSGIKAARFAAPMVLCSGVL
ncbi:MAG: TSUP family transporter [Gaiellaceae bacterium]